ncbi:MAG: DUF4231 domain-containing protein [Pirellulales bacterium]|nr:DUF4231 domain-containing protein [Pirellulales bacterium]
MSIKIRCKNPDCNIFWEVNDERSGTIITCPSCNTRQVALREGLANDLLLEEFRQAWSHYRHLESARTQYLGFFFASLFAYVGIAISATKNVQPENTAWVALLLLTLNWLLFILTLSLFVGGIRKMGNLLFHYENTWKTIRATVYGQEALGILFDVRKKTKIRTGKYKFQNTTVHLLVAFCVLFTGIQIVALWVFSQRPIFPPLIICIFVFYAVTMLVSLFGVLLYLGPKVPVDPTEKKSQTF